MRKKKKDEPDERGPTSLFLFTPTSPVRKMMTWLVNWPPFDWVIIITIMANCVVMAMDDKLSNNDKSIMSIKLVSFPSRIRKFSPPPSPLPVYKSLTLKSQSIPIMRWGKRVISTLDFYLFISKVWPYRAKSGVGYYCSETLSLYLECSEMINSYRAEAV